MSFRFQEAQLIKDLTEDTILWLKESDRYTQRAFETEKDPYNNLERKNLINSIDKLFKSNDFTPQSVLHIGCSAGFSFTYYLKYFKDAELYGIDPGKKSIRLAKDKYKDKRVKFNIGNAHDLPYKDKSMDVVFLPMVLQWIPRQKLIQSIAEIDRVSRGFIILSEFSPDCPSWSISNHNNKIKIFKQNYSEVFNSFPWWRTVKNEVFNITEGTDFQRSVTILKKLPYTKGYKFRDSVLEKNNPSKWKKI